jgi:tetratricopeptide (TPR) repeat protein
MSGAPEPVGTLEVALAHAGRLLATNPSMAAEQAAEILKVVPDHPVAMLVLGSARRACGSVAAALAILEPLAARQPRWAAAHYEFGLALASAERSDAAIAALRAAVKLKPDMTHAWLALADLLTSSGDAAGADAAYAWHIKTSTRDPRLMQAASALCEGRIAEAETRLREHLKHYPTDVTAIRMLAEVAARLGRYRDAESLLVRCLELAPSFTAARHNYAVVLHRQNKAAAALQEVARLLALDARHPGYLGLQAAILAKIGDLEESIRIYAQVLAAHPQQAKIWMSYGHALKTAGREAESIKAYKTCIQLQPQLGEAYWSLANLKTLTFAPAEVAAMQAQLERPDLTDVDRFHFQFAMGKALEDAGSYTDSFEHYAQGNRLRRAGISYSAAETTAHVERSKVVFTRQFFAERAGYGAQAPDPIFIVGLPRSGSTLLEQILSSHSAVEGTMELPDIHSISRALNDAAKANGTAKYPEALAHLGAAECRALGEQYLAQTRIQRKTGAPFFIDKMPNNFAHIGLIHLALPNSKIIDARRNPLACCFSGFKQHFAMGQNFTYSLEDIGRYYRDYVELMAHFDGVLPGRVHRVTYEEVIDDIEAAVRRLLEYCGLPFEENCLRFYENARAVRTASSQQVRQPIFRDGVEHWRHYEPWLAPLKEALGPALDGFSATPVV